MTDEAAGRAARSGEDARWRFLRVEVDRQLALFGRRRRRDKRKAFVLQMATVMLSATVTVLLGLRTSDAARTLLLNIALVLGALITVLAAAEAFFYPPSALGAADRHGAPSGDTLAPRRFNMAGASGPTSEASALTACLAELDAIIADDLKARHHMHESPPSVHETRLPGAANQATP